MFQLITGGSGSGKSAYAEEELLKFGAAKRYYIATMQSFDEESRKRIERHRCMRAGKDFETIECYIHIENLHLEKEADVLLECMSNLVANEMYEKDGAKENTVESVVSGILQLKGKVRNLVIVTNEIFSDLQDYSEETVRYQDYLGRVNCLLAEEADRVTEVVYGIPVVIK